MFCLSFTRGRERDRRLCPRLRSPGRRLGDEAQEEGEEDEEGEAEGEAEGRCAAVRARRLVAEPVSPRRACSSKDRDDSTARCTHAMLRASASACRAHGRSVTASVEARRFGAQAQAGETSVQRHGRLAVRAYGRMM